MIKMQNICSAKREEEKAKKAQQFLQIIPSILSFNYPGAIFYRNDYHNSWFSIQKSEALGKCESEKLRCELAFHVLDIKSAFCDNRRDKIFYDNIFTFSLSAKTFFLLFI